MSFDCSYLAFHSVPKPEVLALAGLRDTGQWDEANEQPISCAALPTGWTILYFNDSTATLDRIAPLSANHAVLSVIVQEYVPLSIASLHIRSTPFWEVTHDGSKGVFDLQTTGTPPAEFPALKTRFFAEQRTGKPNADHVFDLPIELAALTCGFRYDRWRFDWGQPRFTVATPTRPPSKQTP